MHVGRFEPLPTDPYQHAPGQGQPRHFGAICAACRGQTRLGTKFCTNCHALREDAESGSEREPRFAASRTARFMGALADGLIVSVIGLVIDLANVEGLLSLEIWLGSAIWLIWFAAIAKRGQTPGKQLLSTQVIRTDGSAASQLIMWAREVGYRAAVNAPIILLSQLNPESSTAELAIVLISLIVLADALAIFFNPDRQTLHDRVFRTLVVNVRPVGQTSAELRAL